MDKILKPTANYIEEVFTPLELPIDKIGLPMNCANPFYNTPHDLGRLAAEQLQKQLILPQKWEHNFGLDEKLTGPIIGKMFGVLAVIDKNNSIGFLKSFSGKMAGTYIIDGFVPPIYDSLSDEGFLTEGMIKLGILNDEINFLISESNESNKFKITALKFQRSLHSSALQDRLFQQYSFLNQYKKEKNLIDIFYDYSKIRPSSGAGDCALPKLLQFAFKHDMQPLAMAEFWWGLSPKSLHRQHLAYYPACKEKCKPILQHMLQGIKIETHLNK